jgi:hypothetical protein
MHTFWGEIVITIGLATIMYLTFEAPILLVENYFYNKRVSVSKAKQKKTEDENFVENDEK